MKMFLQSFYACGASLLQMQAPANDARSRRAHAEKCEEQATALLETIALGDDFDDDEERDRP